MRHLCLAASAIVVVTAVPVQAATVDAAAAQPVLIGHVTVGKTYSVVATGSVDLAYGLNGGLGLPFTADGKPGYAFTSPYNSFYPNGLDHDPSQNASAHGVGGAGKLIGSVMISFISNPSSPSDYLMAGSLLTFTASSSGPVYGMVNDCNGCYPDNRGSFDVTLREVTSEAVTFTYDALGRLVSSAPSGGINSGVKVQSCFDPAGNRTRYQVGSLTTTC